MPIRSFHAFRLLAGLLAPVPLAAAAPAPAEPAFVGSAACGACHAAELAAWRGSQHDLAMQEATPAAVLGDFSGATFAYGPVTTRFYTRNGKFFVNTDGPDGGAAEFEVRYAFGVYPLQQYLIALPGGRLQAFGIAWDARPAAQGGQRWFHLYPGQGVRAGESVHWTGRDQTWNRMCAECHSTGVRKGYDAAADRYATSWAGIDVGCEACHGPGSAHLAWADGDRAGPNGLAVHFTERRGVTWAIDPATGNAARSAPRATAAELETCGMCHGLRSPLAEPWRPGRQLLDTHLPTLLDPPFFEADGKMAGEAFNYQAFRQSKMFSKGVTCSDCHQPHDLQLRAEGNAVCAGCHAAAVYDTPAHTRHDAAAAPAAVACVACHMPARTFMQVDVRRDHGFRVPRPDLSAAYPGVTNACSDCHADRGAAWAARAVEIWFGPERKGFQTWTPAFAAARAGQPRAGDLLARVAAAPGTPGIARAAALAELAPFLTPDRLPPVQAGLASPDPLVRVGGLRALAALAPADRWPLAAKLLADPVRGVRIEAVSLLADQPDAAIPPADRPAFEVAAADFLAAQALNADRPEARTNLGAFQARRGRPAAAEAAYRSAIALAPDYLPASVNLADLLGQQGRDPEGERLLRDALARSPDAAPVLHALGLNLVRQDRLPEALASLARAAALDPANARFAYVNAVALNSAGRPDEALRALEAAQPRHPADRAILMALVTLNRDRGDLAAARAWATKLAAVDPSVRGMEQLQ